MGGFLRGVRASPTTGSEDERVPPITQGRQQWVVSHPTFMAWLRFKREHPDAKVLTKTSDDGLLVEGPNGRVHLPRSVRAED